MKISFAAELAASKWQASFALETSVSSSLDTKANGFPSCLLVTWFAPDDRKGGAVITRSLVERFPAGRLKWYSFSRPAGPLSASLAESFLGASPPPGFGNVRLRLGAFWRWYARRLWSMRAARRIARLADSFAAERIWIVLDYPLVPIVLKLCRLLPQIRIHLSIHDDPVATGRREGVPAPVLERMQAALKEISLHNVTYDAVSEELLAVCSPADRLRAVVSRGCEPIAAPCGVARPRHSGTLLIGCAGNFIGHEEVVALAAGLDLWSSRSARDWKLMTFGPCNLDNLHPRVSPHPFCEGETLRRLLEPADLLYMPLPLQTTGIEQMRTSLPTKLVSYLEFGKVILAHVPSGSATARIMREANLGPVVTTNNPALIADAMQEAIDWDVATAEAGRRWLMADRFCPAAIFRRFAGCLAAEQTMVGSDE